MARVRAAAVLTALALAAPTSAGVARPPEAAAPPAAPAFQCEATGDEIGELEKAWGPDRLSWCCKHEGVGCRFDCEAGLSNWRHGWSTEKKAWCCSYAGLGCSGLVHAGAYDCQEGLPNGSKGAAWSESKKAYCCKKESLGCTSKPFDCLQQFATREAAWSDKKKQWCCENEQLGCPTTTTPSPYDCLAGYDDWEKGWSESKKAWCCANEGRACHFDCHAGYFNWINGWSTAKQAWCCRHESRGCQRLPHDCSNVQDVNRTWTAEKKQWCCHLENLGCPQESFDCDAGLARWKTEWSLTKKEHCCKTVGHGCQNATAEAERHDCEGKGLEYKTWSTEKQQWCCDKEGVGCEDRMYLQKKYEFHQDDWGSGQTSHKWHRFVMHDSPVATCVAAVSALVAAVLGLVLLLRRWGEGAARTSPLDCEHGTASPMQTGRALYTQLGGPQLGS